MTRRTLFVATSLTAALAFAPAVAAAKPGQMTGSNRGFQFASNLVPETSTQFPDINPQREQTVRVTITKSASKIRIKRLRASSDLNMVCVSRVGGKVLAGVIDSFNDEWPTGKTKKFTPSAYGNDAAIERILRNKKNGNYCALTIRKSGAKSSQTILALARMN